MDLYSTTQHNVYYDKYGLYVATVLNEPVIIGAVLPTYPESVRDCFISYQQEHQLEIHEIIEQFIRTDKVCTIAAVIFNSQSGQIPPPEPPVVKPKHLERTRFPVGDGYADAPGLTHAVFKYWTEALICEQLFLQS